MNYKKIYDNLVFRSRNRTLNCYSENHHIIPKCLGGPDDDENLVALTGREHFIAHLLLARIHGGTLWHAVHMMSNMKRYTNRAYERARIEHARLLGEQNTRTKSKPKEIRYYNCRHCEKLFEKLEFIHHPIKENYQCRSCSASYNGKNGKKNTGPQIHLRGRPTWNKGIPNSLAAENGRKGALAQSKTVTGRKRKYLEDGSWTWQYPPH